MLGPRDFPGQPDSSFLSVECSDPEHWMSHDWPLLTPLAPGRALHPISKELTCVVTATQRVFTTLPGSSGTLPGFL